MPGKSLELDILTTSLLKRFLVAVYQQLQELSTYHYTRETFVQIQRQQLSNLLSHQFKKELLNPTTGLSATFNLFPKLGKMHIGPTH